MCNIQLIGLESSRYNDVKDLITSFLEKNKYDIAVHEHNDIGVFSELNISSIPTVNYRKITLGLGNEPDLVGTLNHLFEEVKFDYNHLTYRCKNAAIFHQCDCQ